MIDAIDFWIPLWYPGCDILPGYYYINTNGQVYSSSNNCIMSDSCDGRGYRLLSLVTYNGRMTFRVHRLVMMCFNYIEGCEYLEVNHRDGIKYHNYLSNLEWATPLENILHALEMGLAYHSENSPLAILSNTEVITICELLSIGTPIADIIKIIGNTDIKSMRNTIHSIRRRDSWKYISRNYIFPDYDSSTRLFSDDEAVQIVEFLKASHDYKMILTLLGYDINEMTRSELKNYSRNISRIRTGSSYKEFTDNIDFGPHKSSKLFTDEQIHEICKYLEMGLSFDDILQSLTLTERQKNAKTIRGVLSAIKTRRKFTDISSNYNF